jgi:hypothetical protein
MNRLRDLLLFVPLAACYLFICRQNPDLAPHLPIFLGFMAAFLVLPALGLGGLLVRTPLSLAERLALGSPAALAMLFVVAYAGAALRQPLLLWVQPALGLAACCTAFGPGRRTSAKPGISAAAVAEDPVPATPWGDLLLILVVLTAALALCLPKLAGVSLPNPGMTVEYYIDDIMMGSYIFSVLRALEHGLPYMHPMVAGGTLTTHMLYHFCYAACTLTTSIHPIDLVIFLWPPVLWLFLASAAVVGCRRLAGFTLLETFLAIVLLLFTSGVNFFGSPSVQLFGYQHTFFLGLPALILFTTTLYGYLSGRRPRLFAVHAALSYLICASTKAPLLMLLPVSLLPVLFLRLFKRQIRAMEFLLAGLVIAFAATLRLTIYPDTGIVATHLPKLMKLPMGTLGNLGEMAVVLGPYLILATLALESNPVLRLKTKRAGQYLLFCATFVLVSAFMLKLFNFVGGDFYFFWQARILVLLAFAPVAAHILAWRMPRFVPVLALLLVLGVGVTLQRIFLPLDIYYNDVPEEAQAKYLDAGEREGLRWASTNLDHRSTFFTNKDSYLGSYMGGFISLPLFDYLGFSGMQGYAFPMRWLPENILRTANERIKILEGFHKAPSPEAKAEILAQTPVDYYLHCTRLAPQNFAVPDCLRVVHNNQSIIIFENTCRPK